MKKHMLLLGLSLLFTQVAQAKDYIVELIVFGQTSSSKGVSWQPGVMLPRQPRGISVFGAVDNPRFRAMESGPALSGMAQELSLSSKHPLIAYRTWRQPGLPRDSAQAIRFNVGEPFDTWDSNEKPPRARAKRGVGKDYLNYTLAQLTPESNNYQDGTSFQSAAGVQRRSNLINGIVTVSLGRYLHLNTELVYTDIRKGRSTLQSDHRRMRSQRLHYIDNPVFGIIAHIIAVEDLSEAQAQQFAPDF